MSQPPTKSQPTGSAVPRKPFQFSLSTLFLGMLTVCVVLGIGYTTAAVMGDLGVGILASSIGAVVAAIIWTAVLTRSWGHTLVRSLYLLGIGLLIVALLPPMNMVRSGRKVSCPNSLKQITLALMLYEMNEGSFPPAYTVDAQGNRLHSWRTLILPYIEMSHLQGQMDLNQPWNAPVNRPSSGVIMGLFQCPEHPDYEKKPFTSYVAVVGPHTMWPGEEGRKMAEVADGTSQTVILVEISRSDIGWAEPRDLTLEEIVAAHRAGNLTGISSFHTSPTFTFADNHVLTIDPADLTEAELRAMFTVDGGEDVKLP